jgi:hypothetical protein
LITFGANGISVFQDVKTSVIVQLKDQIALFMIGVHCINLAIQTLSKMGIVGKLKISELVFLFFS